MLEVNRKVPPTTLNRYSPTQLFLQKKYSHHRLESELRLENPLIYIYIYMIYMIYKYI